MKNNLICALLVISCGMSFNTFADLAGGKCTPKERAVCKATCKSKSQKMSHRCISGTQCNCVDQKVKKG